MSLPASSPYRSRPHEPVTDAERERLSARLNTAYAEGGLDTEAYQTRLDALFAAQTLGQLVPVVEGLPAAPTYREPAIVAQSGPSRAGRPGEVTPARTASRLALVAVGGTAIAVLLIVVLLFLLL